MTQCRVALSRVSGVRSHASRHDPCTAQQSALPLSRLRSLALRIGSANTILHSVSIVTMGMGAMGGWAGASQRHRHREMPIGHLQQQRVSLELQSRPRWPTARPSQPDCHGNPARKCADLQARIRICIAQKLIKGDQATTRSQQSAARAHLAFPPAPFSRRLAAPPKRRSGRASGGGCLSLGHVHRCAPCPRVLVLVGAAPPSLTCARSCAAPPAAARYCGSARRHAAAVPPPATGASRSQA